MKISEFNYHLPEELIAQVPSPKRAESRLMVVDRQTGTWQHHDKFYEIQNLLRPGDVLVLNNTKVIPARLSGKRSSGGKVEMLVVAHAQDQAEVLIQTTRRPKTGETYAFGHYQATVTGRGETGWLVQFHGQAVSQIMEQIGLPPLPPYIKRKGGQQAQMSATDQARYQTVFAQIPGAIAAPTAGLHFTEELLQHIINKEITITTVTLHVGTTTFFPVRCDEVEQHVMGKEWYSITAETANCINQAKQQGRRVVAVGTTSCRTVETAGRSGQVTAGDGWSNLFIYPGFSFQIVNALITNFHLPQSTLLLLISAFAGKELILKAYAEAIASKYRFYSYGDAMFIQ